MDVGKDHTSRAEELVKEDVLRSRLITREAELKFVEVAWER